MLRKTTMKQHAIALALAALLAAPAQSAIVSIVPSVSSQVTGSQFSLDVNVSGLGTEIVSVIDLNVYFDPAILAAVSITLGPGLGGPWTDLSTLLADSFDLFVYSNLVDPFDPATDDALAALQADGSFTLLTLTFDAIGPGISEVSFGLGANERDIVGRNAEFLAVTYNGACVAVNSPTGGNFECPIQIAEPGSAALAALALSSALWAPVALRRRRDRVS